MNARADRPRRSGLDREALDEVFDGLKGAYAGDLTGSYRVVLASAPGIDRLPRAWSARLLRVVNAVMPLAYRGKEFEGLRGSNVLVGGLRLGHYSLHEVRSPPGALVVDYDVDANPRVIRRAAAVVRLFDDGAPACRMVWRGRRGRDRTILYFTLVRG